jgi:hypothetical protein
MDFGLGVIIIGVALIVFLIGILFFMPTEKKEDKKKKKAQPEVKEGPQKDLKLTIEKLEHHIHTLHQQIASFEKKERDHEKQLLVEHAKIKKLQEKLSQEREWQEKDHLTTERRSKELKETQEELKKTQESYTKEHSLNLKLQQELKDLQKEHESVNSLRRQAESVEAQLKATIERYRQDTVELKAENIELKKKKDDTVWIAKSEYERVDKLVREKEKELELLRKRMQV